MRYRISEFLEATFPIGDLNAEQILMVAVEWFAVEVFVRVISQGHSSARQDILDPSAQARLFLLRRMQCIPLGAQKRTGGSEF